MRSPQSKRGFTLIELLVVIAIIAILASILFPVFAKAREKARQATCLSQQRQLATAIQMYSQDNNGQYPPSGWVSPTATYLGGSDKMYACPSDGSMDTGGNSYGYAGILVRKDGTGVKEAQVISPSEVGVCADALPTKAYPGGGLIGGGGMGVLADVAVEPASRHSKGIIAGFADGHAKYFPGQFNVQDMGNGIARAFYHVVAYGLIDNPLGTIGSGTAIGGSYGSITVGGEYGGKDLLMAAALMYGNYYTRGFNGGTSSTSWRGANYAWARETNVGIGYGSAVAYKAYGIIVAKNSKIPTIGAMNNGTYTTSNMSGGTAWVKYVFQVGYALNSVQAYHLPIGASDLGALVAARLGGITWGPDSVEVIDESEMVEKVANDPFGIGYCDLKFADPDRVSIVSIGAEAWPSKSVKYRWVVPARAQSSWPWWSQINIEALGTGGLALKSALETGAFATGLRDTAMFKGPGYAWP